MSERDMKLPDGKTCIDCKNWNRCKALIGLTGKETSCDFSPSRFVEVQLLKYMTEPELSVHISNQLKFIRSCQTPDTIGSMLVIFGDDGICQYGATIDPETAPAALRELADRIEKRQTVKR